MTDKTHPMVEVYREIRGSLTGLDVSTDTKDQVAAMLTIANAVDGVDEACDEIKAALKDIGGKIVHGAGYSG